MYNSVLLDTVIGLCFIYLIYSFLCIVITEIITRFAKKRYNLLKNALYNLFDNVKEGHLTPIFKESIHLVLGDVKKEKFYEKITKITPSQLTDAVKMTLKKDIINPKRPPKDAPELANYIDKLKNILGEVDLVDGKKPPKKDEISNDLLDKLEAKLNERLGSLLDAVYELYRRHAQKLAMIIAFVLVVFNNVDSIKYAKKIYTDTALRNVLVASAEKISEKELLIQPKPEDEDQTVRVNTDLIKVIKSELEITGLELGVKSWCDEPLFKKICDKTKTDEEKSDVLAKVLNDNAEVNIGWWIQKILGLLLTTALVSLGAPFWLDAIKKMVGLKKNGKQDSAQGQTGADAPAK